MALNPLSKIVLMKKIVCFLFFLITTIVLFSQNHQRIDSLRNRLLYAETDTTKIISMYNIAMEYQQYNTDTALLISLQAYKKSKKINYIDGISRSATIISNIYRNAGNYSKALEYSIAKLKAEETRSNTEILTIAIMQLANTYQLDDDYKKASTYAFRADSIIDTDTSIRYLKLSSLINIGDLFEKVGNLPVALDYTQRAYLLAIKENNLVLKGYILNNLGNIYSKFGKTQLAIQNYGNAIQFLEAVKANEALAETTLGLAKQYQSIAINDSALFYGKKSYSLCKKNGFLSRQLDACLFLTKYYKNNSDIKNAFIFQEEVLFLKDSIFSKDRIAKSQLLTIEEEARQKELAEQKQEAAAERIVKLQYLTIGILLPVLFFVTIFLSNRKIKPKYIEFLGLVSLLLTFEYIMLLLHPVIVSITNHNPFYQLLIFAVVASILTPIHHRVENWLTKILTKKGRISLFKIRMQ